MGWKSKEKEISGECLCIVRIIICRKASVKWVSLKVGDSFQLQRYMI